MTMNIQRSAIVTAFLLCGLAPAPAQTTPSIAERAPLQKTIDQAESQIAPSPILVNARGAELAAPPIAPREADEKPLNFAATQSDKQKHAYRCRARYRDCIKANQIPSFECQFVYQDCINHIY